MEFEESLNQVAAKVRDLKDGIETEEATKNAFIMPFIGQVLGYDVFNPTEVVPEFTADVGVKKGEKSTTRSCTTVKCRFLSNARRSAYRSAWRTQASCTGISR